MGFSITTFPKDFIRLKILIVIIAIILEVYYKYLIVPEYDYFGFNLDFSISKYIISKIGLLALLLLSLVIYNRSKFLYTIYLLLVFFFYIPNSILFSMGNFPYAPFLSNLFFVASFVLSAFIKIKAPNFSIPEKYKAPTLIILSVLFIAPIVYIFNDDVNLKTLLLKQIYKTRDVFSDKIAGYANYLYHLSVKTILPIALVFFMIKKKPAFIVLYVLLLLYLFVISGNKFVYFTSITLLCFYYVGKDYTSKIKYFFIATIVLFLIFPVIDYSIIKGVKPIFSGTFVNRFLFIPSLLTQWYFEFFDGKPFYFAESHFFNQFVKSPYDLPVGFLISKTYLNTTDTYANNGIVSDGFMNLGYIGVALFSLIFSALFAFFNSLKLNKGYYGLYFSYVYLILSAPLLGSFITGGILLFIFLAIFIIKEKEIGNAE